MPRVSVIVPAYRAEGFIARTIASVRAQTYTDWEVVVADDASPDETTARAKAAGAIVVRGERNQGPAGARNLALQRASGALMAFLDADDEWLPGYLASQVAAFDDAGAGVGLVACDARVLTATGMSAYTYFDQFAEPVDPLTLERLLRGCCIGPWALVPRAVGEQVGWFDPELFGTEDHDLWLRILERGHRAVVNPEVLAVYRHVEGSVSSNVASQGANNQKTYANALARGRLGPAERKVAEDGLRYNVAMQAVAQARFQRHPGPALCRLPTLARVAVTRRDLWRQWARVLRGHRAVRGPRA